MRSEWDWPPKRKQTVELEFQRREPPKTFWNTRAAKRAGDIWFGSAVFTVKAICAVILGLVIAGGLWFLELLTTAKG